MSFPTAGQGYKKKKKKDEKNCTSVQADKIKIKFTNGGKKVNKVSYLGDDKCKCANQMCISVFITELKTKILLLLLLSLLLNVFPSIHSVFSFHNLDLFISFVIYFECFCLD